MFNIKAKSEGILIAIFSTGLIAGICVTVAGFTAPVAEAKELMDKDPSECLSQYPPLGNVDAEIRGLRITKDSSGELVATLYGTGWIDGGHKVPIRAISRSKLSIAYEGSSDKFKLEFELDLDNNPGAYSTDVTLTKLDEFGRPTVRKLATLFCGFPR